MLYNIYKLVHRTHVPRRSRRFWPISSLLNCHLAIADQYNNILNIDPRHILNTPVDSSWTSEKFVFYFIMHLKKYFGVERTNNPLQMCMTT